MITRNEENIFNDPNCLIIMYPYSLDSLQNLDDWSKMCK